MSLLRGAITVRPLVRTLAPSAANARRFLDAPSDKPKQPPQAGPHVDAEELCLSVSSCDGKKGRETCINCYLRGGTAKINCAEARKFEADQERKLHFSKETTA